MTRKNERFVSPKGLAKYPHLNAPDTKWKADGEYTTKLILKADDESTKKFIAQLDQQYSDALVKVKEEEDLKKVKEGPRPYSLDEEEGVYEVKFKQAAIIRPKGKDPISMSVALFDAKCVPLKKDVRIGGGSTIRVTYEPRAYYTKLAGAGLTLQLKAVQVIDLQQYSANAESFMFEEEDGFSSTETAAPPADEPAAETNNEDDNKNGSDF
jgi:hypothetical protein